MSALYMLEADQWPQGLYPVCNGDHYMTIAADFSRPFRKGFEPPPDLAARSIPRTSTGHMSFGSCALNGELLDLVEAAHGRATWVVGEIVHETEEGDTEAPCGYGYVGGRLVAMLAPMVPTRGRWS